MQERPIVIKYETNTEARERLAQRLDSLNRQYDKMIQQKAYPSLFNKDK